MIKLTSRQKDQLSMQVRCPLHNAGPGKRCAIVNGGTYDDACFERRGVVLDGNGDLRPEAALLFAEMQQRTALRKTG